MFVHSRPQWPHSFWSAPRIATSDQVQRHSGFKWICKHNRLRPEPIRLVRLDSEHAWIADFRCWTWPTWSPNWPETWPEVTILGTDQKERGLWGREWCLKWVFFFLWEVGAFYCYKKNFFRLESKWNGPYHWIFSGKNRIPLSSSSCSHARFRRKGNGTHHWKVITLYTAVPSLLTLCTLLFGKKKKNGSSQKSIVHLFSPVLEALRSLHVTWIHYFHCLAPWTVQVLAVNGYYRFSTS